MTPSSFFVRVGAFIVLGVAAVASAQAPPLPLPATRPDNYYGAGNRIEVSRAMLGDVVVAGRQIEITQPVVGDILAAGWRISLSGRADDDVRMAGAEITVNAPVNGDLTIAGGDVVLGAGSRVNGRSWITGGQVRLDGQFDRELRVAGGTVQIGGELRRPVTIIAEKVELLPTARILGTLEYKAPVPAVIATGATVAGPVTFTRIESREAREAHSFRAVSTVLFTFHLVIAGLLLLWLMPGFLTRIVDTLRAAPARSALFGFAVLVAMPVAAVILIFSVLALPIGLTLAALYFVGMLTAVIAIASYIGDLEARIFKRSTTTYRSRAVWLVAGVLSLAILRAVPILGTIVVFTCVLFGLGALTLAAHEAYRRGAVTMAA
ncbi:MAG TPA: polymer-forming cytoskeletal protein [Vicinamibacterales bacterium]|nr:polymer-forming cytoskeletal protein [Vicinamibacterales bacterium]